MFREMRRSKQQLSDVKCKEVLSNGKRGVLSIVGENGYPYGIPMDYYYDEKTNCIYYHCAKVGHKIDALKMNDKASFTVYDEGYKEGDDWFYKVHSVICFGNVEIVSDDINLISDKVYALGMKYAPSKEYVEQEIKESLKNVQLLVLHIEYMSGKLVTER